MKIQYMSDLHLEFHQDLGISLIESIPVIGDVLVLAGDITSHKVSREMMIIFCEKWDQVVYVPGNHEFYGSSIPLVINMLRNLEDQIPNLTVLYNSQKNIGGYHFLGGTLWFSLNYDNPYLFDPAEARKMYPDFSQIREFSQDVYYENDDTVSFLKNNIREGSIVVTHMAPSRRSISRGFQNSPLNKFFVCDMDEVVVLQEPSYWIHGHMHSTQDYLLGETRVLCNPLGYPGAFNREYNEHNIIEV